LAMDPRVGYPLLVAYTFATATNDEAALANPHEMSTTGFRESPRRCI